jgi:hypothetical protein
MAVISILSPRAHTNGISSNQPDGTLGANNKRGLFGGIAREAIE